MTKSGKVLITGVSGFIGFHLINEALKNNLEVFGAVRQTSKVDHLKGMDVTLRVINLSDEKDVRSNFEKDGYDYVIHAAGTTRAATLKDYEASNVIPTLTLAKVAKEFSVKKFVYYSSLAALGPLKYTDPNPITENKVPQPITNYGRSKLNAEIGLQKYKAVLPLVILRPTAVYGPREKDLLIMFRSLMRHMEPYIGNGKQKLSFIHGEDLAKATLSVTLNDIQGEVYDLSDGNAYEREELAKYTKEALNKKTIKIQVPMPVVRLIATIMEATHNKKVPVINHEKLGELTAENWNCSIEKAKKDFNFTPQYNLKEGILQTINWYKENNWL